MDSANLTDVKPPIRCQLVKFDCTKAALIDSVAAISGDGAGTLVARYA